MSENIVKVLDKGYVILREVLVENDDTTKDSVLQFEIYAPMMVRSQWFKYTRNSEHTPPMFFEHPVELAESGNGDDGRFDDALFARNEASRRYVTMAIEHYVPQANEWRSKPANSKQGSGEPLSTEVGLELTQTLEQAMVDGLRLYEKAIDKGVATEQARLFLPNVYGLYTAWYWTASAEAVLHFLRQRLEHDAQKEIQLYAQAVRELVQFSDAKFHLDEL